LSTQTDQIRQGLARHLTEGVKKGAAFIEINSGDLGRALELYSGPERNRMPNVCRVMRNQMQGGDTIVSDTLEGYDGPRLTIRYALPRASN